MKDHQPDVLLIFYKRKSGTLLTDEEEQAWTQYRKKYALSDEASLDEKKMIELIRLQQRVLPWDQFEQNKKNKEVPIAYPDAEKQTATVKVKRLKPFYWSAVAASLLLVITTIWITKPDKTMIEVAASAGSLRELLLPDGTKVWLNAATSFRYPATFNDEERIVELEKGEALFEVTKGTPSQPFIVLVKGKQVQVMGTRFNISAYDSMNNIVTTTLLEGKVSLKAGKEEKTLIPGQQAVMYEKSIAVNAGVNLEDVTAWKKGLFTFHDTRLSIIMEELARWYDVKVQYDEPMNDYEFTVDEYNRRDSLEGLLDHLEASKLLHFKLEDKKVIISKP